MEYPFQFTYIEILKAPARALSAKKILVMSFFLFIGLALYNIFTYLAFSIEGERLSVIFSAFGFFPFYKMIFVKVIAQVIFLTGLFLSLLALMAGFMGVSIIEVEAMRGNRFLSPFQAIGFSFRRLKQIFLSELSFILFILLIILLLLIFGLIGRIPYIGEWIVAVFFVVPGFIIGILTVFILVVFQISVILLPSVTATERHGETFTAILETFSTIIRQPFRWFLFSAYTIIAGKITSFVYAYFSYRAVEFVVWGAMLGGGNKIEQLVKNGLGHLPLKSDIVRETFNIFPGIDWGVNLSRHLRGAGDDTAGYLMAFMLFLIFLTIIAYFLTVIAVGQVRAFAVIKYLKDSYKITNEKSLFESKERQETSPEDINLYTEND